MKRTASNFENQRTTRLAYGAAAGLIGGLVGAAVMNRVTTSMAKDRRPRHVRRAADQGSQLSKRRGHEPRPATYRAADILFRRGTGYRPTPQQAEWLGAMLHFLFGGFAGAAYGALGTRWPTARAGFGLPFAVALWAAADETAVPLAGLARPPQRMAWGDHLNSLVSHLVFGAVTEIALRTADAAQNLTPRGAAPGRAAR